MAVARRPVQRGPATPEQFKGGGGVGVAQRVTPTSRSRYPSRNRLTAQGGTPGLFFVFRPAGGKGRLGVLAVLAHTAGRTCRRTNRGNAESDAKWVCEPTETGEI